MRVSQSEKILSFADWIYNQAKTLNRKLSYKKALTIAIETINEEQLEEYRYSRVYENYYTHDTFEYISSYHWEIAIKEKKNSTPNDGYELEEVGLTPDFISSYMFNAGGAIDTLLYNISTSNNKNSYMFNDQIIKNKYSYNFSMDEPVDTLMFFEKNGHIVFSSHLSKQRKLLKDGYKFSEKSSIDAYKKENNNNQMQRRKKKSV